MAEPKKKSTRMSRGQRLAKSKQAGFNLIKCPKCGTKILPHHVCQTCGFYKSKKLIETVSPTAKKVTTKVTKK